MGRGGGRARTRSVLGLDVPDLLGLGRQTLEELLSDPETPVQVRARIATALVSYRAGDPPSDEAPVWHPDKQELEPDYGSLLGKLEQVGLIAPMSMSPAKLRELADANEEADRRGKFPGREDT
jgi:hypothetical protein